MQLINQVSSVERVIALDPSFISKAGRSTFSRGKYWSVVAGTAKWGLDICGFAVIDIANNTALSLNKWQMPSADELKESGLSLLTYYVGLVSENAKKFKDFLNIWLIMQIIQKKPYIDAACISSLRYYSVLRYKYYGEKTGNKGRQKQFSGNVDVRNLDNNYFFLDLTTEKIVQYYCSRFQIEFLYRDAKQFTGLTTCQARSEKKLDFNFNAALTQFNLAKYDWLNNKYATQIPFSMANYKTLSNNTLMLERFMCRFAINPNTAKNQKIGKELL